MMDEFNNLLLFPLTETSGKPIVSDTQWNPIEGLKPDAPTEKLVAVDFETYYSASYSLRNMSAWEYVHHSAFDPYLVALRMWDGSQWWSWVGHPKDAPWEDLAGILWLSHNAGFDELVYRMLVKAKTIPRVIMGDWLCTADMATFLQAGRSLESAVKNLMNVTISKDVREQMKFGGASAAEIREYASGDAKWCAEIFMKWSHRWPPVERVLSKRTRHQGWVGVGIDRPAIEAGIAHMQFVMDNTAKQLPWYGKSAVTSYKSYVQACYSKGILPAESLGSDSSSAQQWEDNYGHQYPWISNIRRYTKARQTQGSLQMLLDRSRADDTVPFGMSYSKAMPTRRWQHEGGLRMQNLDKAPCEGVMLRHMFVPRKGYVFVIADLSQIEPRVLNWLVGDTKFLDACAAGASPYEAHARSSMGYTDPGQLKKVDASMYALAKVRVLALGYGAGPPKFVEMAKDMCGLTIYESEQAVTTASGHTMPVSDLNRILRSGSDPNMVQAFNERTLTYLPSAIEAVRDFRDSSPKIVSYWKKVENALRKNVGRNHVVTMPSGGTMRYFDVKQSGKELHAWVVRNSANPKDHRYLYGGKLVENEVQFESRNVFADCLYRIEANHHKICRILWSVHDEVICEVPERHAEEALAAILHEMHTAPSWAKGLPIAAEGEITTHYQK